VKVVRRIVAGVAVLVIVLVVVTVVLAAGSPIEPVEGR
jgi:hypothetical protein